jgi:hypothetical protein
VRVGGGYGWIGGCGARSRPEVPDGTPAFRNMINIPAERGKINFWEWG